MTPPLPKPDRPHPAGVGPAASSRLRVRPGIPLADVPALFLLLGLALLLLGRQILLGGTFYNDDIVLQSMPVYSWYASGLKQGRVPVWSPDILGGFPLAFGQYGFFYPPDMLLFRLLDGPRAFHLSLALHLALAGVCGYWYCRVLGMRRLPSLLGAVAFQMGNEVLSWPANGFITKTLFALPALLSAVELTFRRGCRHWLLVPLVVGGALLVGYAQIVLFALAVAGLYALVVALDARPRLGGLRVMRRLALLGLGVALGLGLAAVRVVPTLGVTALSTRAEGLAVDQASVDSIHPLAMVMGYLLPASLELPGIASARPDYVGAPALLLAALAVLHLRRLGAAVLFHGGLAALGIVLAMGEHTPLYGLLLQLPFFSYFRGAGRFSLVAALAIAVLAAWTLDRKLALELPGRRTTYRVAVAVALGGAALGVAALAASVAFQIGTDPISEGLRGVVASRGLDPLNVLRPRVGIALLALVATPLLLVGCARGAISHRALEWSIVGLTAATLFTLGWIQNPWLPPAALAEPPALLERLREDGEPFRVFSYGPRVSTYNVALFYEDMVGRPPSLEFDERYLRQFIPPNLGMMFGVATADGYEALQSRRQALVTFYMGSDRVDYARYSDGDRVEWQVHSLSLHDRLNLLAALNVRYLLHAFPVEDPRLERLDEVAVQIYPELPAVARVHLHRVKTALPRALVVPESIVVEGEKELLETLLAGSVDLQRAVLLEERPPAPDGGPLTVEGSSVEMVEYGEHRVVLRAHTDGSGYLVLMDFLLPGWTATVDGRPESVLAANFAGRAVVIGGPGDHSVVFSYEPPLLREGLAVSLLSLLAIAAAALAPGPRCRPGRP